MSQAGWGHFLNTLPVISQLKALGHAVTGDLEGARQTQESFLNEGILVSQVKSAVQAMSGDTKGARLTQERFLTGQLGILQDTGRLFTMYHLRDRLGHADRLESLPSWMARVPDDVSLFEITLPGSHHSSAYQFRDTALNMPMHRTQSFDIYHQLVGGVRWLHCFVSQDKETQQFWCSTGSSPMSKLDSNIRHEYTVELNDVLAQVSQFLKTFQSETVVIHVDMPHLCPPGGVIPSRKLLTMYMKQKLERCVVWTGIWEATDTRARLGALRAKAVLLWGPALINSSYHAEGRVKSRSSDPPTVAKRLQRWLRTLHAKQEYMQLQALLRKQEEKLREKQDSKWRPPTAENSPADDPGNELLSSTEAPGPTSRHQRRGSKLHRFFFAESKAGGAAPMTGAKFVVMAAHVTPKKSFSNQVMAVGGGIMSDSEVLNKLILDQLLGGIEDADGEADGRRKHGKADHALRACHVVMCDFVHTAIIARIVRFNCDTYKNSHSLASKFRFPARRRTCRYSPALRWLSEPLRSLDVTEATLEEITTSIAHSNRKVPTAQGIVREGVPAWVDRDYTYTNIPKQLLGGTIIRWPHEAEFGLQINIELLARKTTVYVIVESKRNGGLPRFFREKAWVRASSAPRVEGRKYGKRPQEMWFKVFGSGKVSLPPLVDTAVLSVITVDLDGGLASSRRVERQPTVLSTARGVCAGMMATVGTVTAQLARENRELERVLRYLTLPRRAGAGSAAGASGAGESKCLADGSGEMPADGAGGEEKIVASLPSPSAGNAANPGATAKAGDVRYATHDLEPMRSGDLRLRAGDRIVVLDNSPYQGWLLGKVVARDETGVFPASLVRTTPITGVHGDAMPDRGGDTKTVSDSRTEPLAARLDVGVGEAKTASALTDSVEKLKGNQEPPSSPPLDENGSTTGRAIQSPSRTTPRTPNRRAADLSQCESPSTRPLYEPPAPTSPAPYSPKSKNSVAKSLELPPPSSRPTLTRRQTPMAPTYKAPARPVATPSVNARGAGDTNHDESDGNAVSGANLWQQLVSSGSEWTANDVEMFRGAQGQWMLDLLKEELFVALRSHSGYSRRRGVAPRGVTKAIKIRKSETMPSTFTAAGRSVPAGRVHQRSGSAVLGKSMVVGPHRPSRLSSASTVRQPSLDFGTTSRSDAAMSVRSGATGSSLTTAATASLTSAHILLSSRGEIVQHQDAASAKLGQSESLIASSTLSSTASRSPASGIGLQVERSIEEKNSSTAPQIDKSLTKEERLRALMSEIEQASREGVSTKRMATLQDELRRISQEVTTTEPGTVDGRLGTNGVDEESDSSYTSSTSASSATSHGAQRQPRRTRLARRTQDVLASVSADSPSALTQLLLDSYQMPSFDILCGLAHYGGRWAPRRRRPSRRRSIRRKGSTSRAIPRIINTGILSQGGIDTVVVDLGFAVGYYARERYGLGIKQINKTKAARVPSSIVTLRDGVEAGDPAAPAGEEAKEEVSGGTDRGSGRGPDQNIENVASDQDKHGIGPVALSDSSVLCDMVATVLAGIHEVNNGHWAELERIKRGFHDLNSKIREKKYREKLRKASKSATERKSQEGKRASKGDLLESLFFGSRAPAARGRGSVVPSSSRKSRTPPRGKRQHRRRNSNPASGGIGLLGGNF